MLDYEERLSHTRDFLATRQIDASYYRDMKSQYSEKISTLESQLTRLNYDVDDAQNLTNNVWPDYKAKECSENNEAWQR